MRYKIEDIDGIGRFYRSKLSKAGINSTGDLLEHRESVKGRQAGVDAVEQLRTRRAASLAAATTETKAKKKLTRGTPFERQVAVWICRAKGMSALNAR